MVRKGFAEEKIDADSQKSSVLTLENLPTPQVDNLQRATKDELAEEFITLRMFTASLFMQYKDVVRDYAVLQERVTSTQSHVEYLEHRLRQLEVGDEPHED